MLALLALSSPALAYSVCTGEDCCLSGDTDHGKVCVLARGEKVLAPDGRSMVDIHVVQKRKKGKQTGTYSGGGDILFHGLADADGAVLIPPRYDGFFEPIGPRAVLATRAGGPLLLVTPEGEAPAGFIRTESVGLSHGVVLRFAVTKVGGDGRLDIAPLHADGSLGDPIYGVLAPGGHRAIVSLGDVAVVTIAESPNGPRGSIFVDVTGAQWSPGREVMTLAEVSPSDKAPTMHAFIDVGPSPIGPVGPMPRLLVPIESSGRPVALSPAVVGVVPLEIVPPRGARREAQVVSWAVVVRAEGGGHLPDGARSRPRPSRRPRRHAARARRDPARLSQSPDARRRVGRARGAPAGRSLGDLLDHGWDQQGAGVRRGGGDPGERELGGVRLERGDARAGEGPRQGGAGQTGGADHRARQPRRRGRRRPVRRRQGLLCEQQILNPSVNVTVYDGGRVQTQTMSMDEYTERY